MWCFFWFLRPIEVDGDTFHHLNTGKWVLEHHQIPSTDEWTFTSTGNYWIANAWGFDVIFYSIFSLFGYVGLSIFFSLIGVLTITLLFIWLRLNQIKYPSVFLALGITMTIISARWLIKPELVIYPLILGILIINKLHQKKSNVIYFLPLLMFIWSILYGLGVFIGAIIIILLLEQFYIDGFKFKSLKFYLIYTISLLVIFFNGFGFKNIFYFLLISDFKSYLSEWKVLLFNMFNLSFELKLTSQYQILMYLIYLIIFVLLLIFRFKEAKKEKILLILSLGVLLPFSIIRNIPLAIILSISMWTKLLPNKKKLLWIILVLFLIISFWTNQHGIGFNNQDYSTKIISFFKENNLKGNVLADQNFAPFLSFELYPEVLIYFDTRDDLYINSNIVKEYLDSLQSYNGVENLIKKYDISIILVDFSLKSYEPLLFSQDWNLVGVFGRSLLFVKKDLVQLNNLKTYTSINPFSKSFTKSDTPEKAVDEYKNLLNSQKDSPFLTLALASSLNYLKDFKQSIKIINTIKIPSRYSSSVIYSYQKYDLLAVNYLNLRSCIEPKTYIDKLSRLIKHKLIFDPFYKIPGSSDYYYLIYYSICENNFWKAQEYLNKLMNDNTIEANIKNQAVKIIESSFGKSKFLLQ